MPDNPHSSVLNPDLAVQTKQQLKAPIAVLADIASFGTQLMIRVWPHTNSQMADAVMVFHLTRLVVMHVDGMRILTENGAGPTALLQLRGLLEASLLMDWMELGDSETKATYLQVGQWRKRRRLAQAFISGTPENADFVASISMAVTPQQEIDAHKEVGLIDTILKQAQLSPIDAAFAAAFKNYDKDWTEVYEREQQRAAGVQPKAFSIRALADKVGRLREYRYVYSKLSNEAHGSALSSSVSLTGSSFIGHGVRRMNEFGWIFRTAASWALRAYRVILKRYLPNDQSLQQRYLTEWKPVMDQDWKIVEIPERTKI